MATFICVSIVISTRLAVQRLLFEGMGRCVRAGSIYCLIYFIVERVISCEIADIGQYPRKVLLRQYVDTVQIPLVADIARAIVV